MRENKGLSCIFVPTLQSSTGNKSSDFYGIEFPNRGLWKITPTWVPMKM